jgi:hypothetical protein
MKFRHWIIIALIIIALLYIWHIYSSHGGVSGFKNGLGVS